MSDYPLSSPVAAGQATEAEQYNNLRRDALFLGADPSSSASIFDLLSSPQGASLVRSGTSEITVTAPLGLIIGGKICAIHSDKKVSVPEGLFLSPEKLCIYAVPDGTGSFAPEVSRLRAETAGAAYRLLGRFLWDGSAIIPGTLKNGDPEPDFPMLTQGRLTAVSGDPFPESDVSYAERIYFTPYGGNQVSLFCGGVWESFTFSEMSLQLSSLSQNTVYDVFLFADGSGLHLSAVPWGSLGPRPVGLLTWRDGVRVSSADPQKKYLGSFALNGSGYTADTKKARLIWNAWNRLPRSLRSELETEPETAYCAVDAWAPVFGADAPQIRLVIGGSEGILRLTGTASTVYQSSADASAGRYAVFGIGKNLSAVSPYSGNTSSAINAWTTGAALQIPELVSHETGLSSWTLCVRANYPFELNAKDSATGAGPALIGIIEA